MIDTILRRVSEGDRLSRAESCAVIEAIVGGGVPEESVAALLSAWHARGETVEEVVGAAEAMRGLAVRLPEAPDAVDTCGTGGDRSGTFNVSTAAAVVVAACGVPVAKHGNRAASSRCGSADVLEALGVRIEIPPGRAAEGVATIGIGFLFARACHPAMARVASVRRSLGTPTIFNRLGPLTNPMRVRHQLVGVGDPGVAEATLECLERLGASAAWVVHSDDGLDEISPCAATRVWTLSAGTRARLVLEPGAFVPRARAEDLKGGDPARNARIVRAVLRGERGAPRDAVLLNAGGALVVAGAVKGLEEGVERAGKAIDDGAASALLDRWIGFTSGGGSGVDPR